jgi:hypothetical protein
VQVKGQLFHGSRHAGFFVRRANPDEHGAGWVVEHREIRLDRYNGAGFSRAFAAHSEQFYADLGVTRVGLDARGAGAYIWATSGYRFRNRDGSLPMKGEEPDLARTWCEERWDTVEALREQGLVSRPTVEELRKRLDDACARFRTPADIAGLGRADSPWTHGAHKLWLGKALLLEARNDHEPAWLGWKPIAA